MPEAPITDKTHPLDAGHTTSEYATTKVMLYMGIVLATLSGVAEAVNQISNILPPGTLITKIGLVCGTLAGVLASVMYGQQRTALKKAALAASPTAGDPASVVKQ